MTWGNKQPKWWATLTTAQRQACLATMDAHGGSGWKHNNQRAGFSVCLCPTTGTATHVELRYRDSNGKILKRWTIDSGTDARAAKAIDLHT